MIYNQHLRRVKNESKECVLTVLLHSLGETTQAEQGMGLMNKVDLPLGCSYLIVIVLDTPAHAWLMEIKKFPKDLIQKSFTY